MTYRYFIELAYKGTNFHGWQIQPNAPTVQHELNSALGILLKEKTETLGAGRTDTGVHARFFTAHFDSQKKDLHLKENLIYKINQLIHKDIAVKRLIPVKEDANARFDAISRTYKYYISKVKDPFLKELCFEYHGKLDINRMNEAAEIILEYEDFTSFCKLHSDVKTMICKIYESKWAQNDEMIVYTIKADRFLRNMVRAIVGTIFDVGRNKIDIERFKQIIESKNRNLASASAPARGLYLTDIEYNNSVYLKTYKKNC